MQDQLARLNNPRNLTIAVLLALFLLLSACGVWYFALRETEKEEVISTLYLVDSSVRMAEAFSGGANSRMDVARNFVRDLVNRSPNENIIGLRVFGSGSNSIGCEDTNLLVPIEPNTQAQIAQELGTIDNVSNDASLVAAALEAIQDLSNSQYGGVLRLIIITGGEDTCLVNSADIIAREAQLNNISLETIIISIDADPREVVSLRSIVADLNTNEVSEAILIEANNEEELAEVFEILEETITQPTSGTGGTGGGGIDKIATLTGSTVTPTPSATPQPTLPPPPTLIPTETSVPTEIPTETAVPTEAPTETPTPTETATPSPSPSPSSTPTASPTATPFPTNTPSSPGGGGDSPAELSVASITVNENAGTATLTILREGGSGNTSVSYRTIDDTALAGSDYTAVNGTVSWSGDDRTPRTVTVPLINDDIAENNETFFFELFSPNNGTIQNSRATVTLNSDDTAGLNATFTASVSEAAGSTPIQYTLTSQPTSDVTIPLTASNSQCSLSVASITLTPANWNSGVSVTVNVDDPQIDGVPSSICTIQTGAATSTTPFYSGLDGSDAAITIYDDDAAYVDATCADGDADGLCDNGFVYRLIQTAVNNSTQNEMRLAAGTYTEGDITFSRDVSIQGAGQASTIVQAAGSPQQSGSRLFTIDSGRTVSFSQLTMQNGFVPNTPGGAISNAGNLTIDQVTLQNNTSGTTGGAIYNTGTLNITNSTLDSNQDGLGGADGFGGALHNAGTATLSNVTVSNNISNPESTGNGRGGGLYNNFGATLTINNSAINSNTSSQLGGGIYSRGTIVVNSTTIDANTSGTGGGFYNGDGSSLTMSDTTLSNNIATADGGGFYSEATGIATIQRTTLNGNQTQNGGHGGGAYTAAGNTWRNVTISGNTASGNGGGLYVTGNSATLQNATLFNNTATNTGGGLYGDSTTQNTIIAGNSAGSGSPDCFSTLFTSLDYNLIQDSSGCNIVGNTGNNITGSTADLAPLANNGRATQTHLPNGTSPAVDAGNPASVTSDGSGGSCLNTDQRSISRPQGSQCDIGSTERD